MKPRLFYAGIIALLLMCASFNGSAQSCTFSLTADKICAGSTITFSSSVSGGTTVSRTWDFGDGFSGSGDTVSHTYLTPGVFVPSLKVTFPAGGTCTKTYSPVRVFALPVSKFTITTEDTMCFKGNELCISDQSVAGPSGAPVSKRTFQLSNGYSRTDFIPYTQTICYRDSIDRSGHLFSLVLEVTDTNNCTSRMQKTDSVLLHRKMDLGLKAGYPMSCYATPVQMTNLSNLPRNEVRTFYWIFGDGHIDSTNWLEANHTYTSKDLQSPYLVVTDIYNCTDTVLSKDSIVSIFPDSLIYISPKQNQCYRNNIYTFESRHNPAAVTQFIYYDALGNEIFGPGVVAKGGTYVRDTFPACGVYRVRMINTYSNCVTVSDTTITVLGPRALQEDAVFKVFNRDQCEAHDTVKFISPVPYLSCRAGNITMMHLWDFNDPFAPPCTTDTRNSINVGVNCNFSKDTTQVKHFYTPGQDRCYFPSLYMKDSVSGCWDSDTISVALTAPDAHPDTTANPPRRGLYYTGVQCLGNKLKFYMNETLPACGYEKAWLNLDSACGKDNWVLADILPTFTYEHLYLSVCDTVNGYVTVGLIVQNGQDRYGTPCMDTAWYHHFLQLTPLIPFFELHRDAGCDSLYITAQPTDTVQHKVMYARWAYKLYTYTSLADLLSMDNTVIIEPDEKWQYFTSPDSIIKPVTFASRYSGIYQVSLDLRNEMGCIRSDFVSIGAGTFREFILPGTLYCVRDTIRLTSYIRYYDHNQFSGVDPEDYWIDTTRALAGKEQVWWDIGDGKGYAYTGGAPVVSYNQPGKYTISMVMRDSLGCFDTIVKPDAIHITEVKAKISVPGRNYFCAPQIVIFTDSSMALDSVGSSTPSTRDAVQSWTWNFGDSTAESVLQHPAHNYRFNGVFRTILTVSSGRGCMDKDTAEINIKGPQPSFVILDTLGCAPFAARFRNTTGTMLKSWTWYFGDPANNSETTLSDSDMYFTYTKPGVYDVMLLGTQDIFNPSTGNTIICPSIFPDTVTGLPVRKVYVLPTLPVLIGSKDTVCPDVPLRFVADADRLYNRFRWDFGDGSLHESQRPDTSVFHTYATPGIYQVSLVPDVAGGYPCMDSAQKIVIVPAVTAGFTIDSAQRPAFIFRNTSQQAVRYGWDFGYPDAGARNRSVNVDGSFDYGKDTGLFKICLMAFSRDDCWDSICKEIRLDRWDTLLIIPNVFTPGNGDDKNDAFDIDILGFTQYHLQIYNRWGTEVYRSDRDGHGNDGINWNGKDHNDGPECSDGVYYFIFTCRLITDQADRTFHGTITLIRDKR
jgi:PKD repeat protein